MIIWITRHSTSSLHAGGLERCQVWFSKPVYLYYDKRTVEEISDLIPWGLNAKEGLGEWGWQYNNLGYFPGSIKIGTNLSFGKLFGYGDEERFNGHVDELAEYVWDKLTEHYGNTEFPHGWYEYEKAGKCRIEEFCLEVDLSIKFNKPK